MRLLKDNKHDIELFCTRGDDSAVPNAILSDLEWFVSSVQTKSTTAVNDARYKILKWEHTTNSSLPHKDDCLKLQSTRASYQIAICRRAKNQSISAMSPMGYECQMRDKNLELTDRNMPAVDEILLSSYEKI